jgi:hypothetical protein
VDQETFTFVCYSSNADLGVKPRQNLEPSEAEGLLAIIHV